MNVQDVELAAAIEEELPLVSSELYWTPRDSENYYPKRAKFKVNSFYITGDPASKMKWNLVKVTGDPFLLEEADAKYWVVPVNIYSRNGSAMYEFMADKLLKGHSFL